VIFRAYVTGADFATLVVRAPSEEEARIVAEDTAFKYGDYPGVELELLDPDGPAEALVEDWS
jgi:hypothetical protein